MPTSPAVVLLSGGLDSTTVLALAKSKGYLLYALSFRYGQRHSTELSAAQRVAHQMGVAQHAVIDLDLRIFGGSALTADLPVPKLRSIEDMSVSIPITYVPARNTIFLSFAIAWAEVLGSQDVFIGVNALDYSGYPDCRPEFVWAFEQVAQLGTRAGVEGRRTTIHAPLIALTKADIVRLGLSLSVDFSLTHSCYDPAPNGDACGTCDSCILRLRAFEEVGVEDPVSYINVRAVPA
jgi:7-cyano-7-deazaguanine synthase